MEGIGSVEDVIEKLGSSGFCREDTSLKCFTSKYMEDDGMKSFLHDLFFFGCF